MKKKKKNKIFFIDFLAFEHPTGKWSNTHTDKIVLCLKLTPIPWHDLTKVLKCIFLIHDQQTTSNEHVFHFFEFDLIYVQNFRSRPFSIRYKLMISHSLVEMVHRCPSNWQKKQRIHNKKQQKNINGKLGKSSHLHRDTV